MDPHEPPSSRSNRAFSRRRVVLGTAATLAGGLALSTLGCGSDDSGPHTLGSTASPAASATPSQPRAGGTVRLFSDALGALPDPHQTKSAAEIFLWQWLGNLLVRYLPDAPFAVEADLAATLPEIPGDGLTFIFKLNPAAKWQNRGDAAGRAVTGDDVKATFDRIKALGAKSPRSGNYTNVDSVAVVDPQTVRFKLKSPQAELLNVIGDQYDIVLPKEAIARGDTPFATAADVTGSGPYELQTYDTAHDATLKRRADGPWKPGTAWVDGLQALDVRDDGQRANGLLGNQGDATQLPPVLARVFDKRDGFTLLRAPSAAREGLLVNHAAAGWKDARVRLAASRAIDRTSLYSGVFDGDGQRGGPMSPAAQLWALKESDLSPLPGYGDRDTDVAEANKLMAAAGFAKGFDDTLLTVTALRLDQAAAQIASDLAAIGIRLTVKTVGDDPAALTELARQGSFNLMLTSVLAGIYPDAQLYVSHRTSGAANYGKFSSSAVDAKLDKQRTLYDLAQRQALVAEIQRDIINAPGPIWLGARNVNLAISNRLHGAVATPFAAGYAFAERAWLNA